MNGTFLGPTLRLSHGDDVRLTVRNGLDEATALHWHGMRLPAAADGGPHQMIDPGEEWTAQWVVDQPAATLWYHPHPHGETERHVYKGLGGMILLEDPQEQALALPREYGVDDVPVIVQDKTFDDAGELIETDRRDSGMLGDTILVNGTAGAVLAIRRELTRLRVLNASTARTYSFAFEDDHPFDMVATDGGLLPAPLELTRIVLSPGERAEIIVTMTAGQQLTLRSVPHDLGLSSHLARRTGTEDRFDVLRLEAAAELRPSPPVPDQLAELPEIDPQQASLTRRFELGSNRINGERMDMERIDFEVRAGATEIWEVVNTHSRPHNFHIHDVQFQVLDIDGAPPPAELRGWKDTVYTPPDVLIRLVMRFGDDTDPLLPYMYHCHLLWHEDEGMMGQFTLVDDEEG